MEDTSSNVYFYQLSFVLQGKLLIAEASSAILFIDSAS